MEGGGIGRITSFYICSFDDAVAANFSEPLTDEVLVVVV